MDNVTGLASCNKLLSTTKLTPACFLTSLSTFFKLVCSTCRLISCAPTLAAVWRAKQSINNAVTFIFINHLIYDCLQFGRSENSDRASVKRFLLIYLHKLETMQTEYKSNGVYIGE